MRPVRYFYRPMDKQSWRAGVRTKWVGVMVLSKNWGDTFVHLRAVKGRTVISLSDRQGFRSTVSNKCLKSRQLTRHCQSHALQSLQLKLCLSQSRHNNFIICLHSADCAYNNTVIVHTNRLQITRNTCQLRICLPSVTFDPSNHWTHAAASWPSVTSVVPFHGNWAQTHRNRNEGTGNR